MDSEVFFNSSVVLSLCIVYALQINLWPTEHIELCFPNKQKRNLVYFVRYSNEMQSLE